MQENKTEKLSLKYDRRKHDITAKHLNNPDKTDIILLFYYFMSLRPNRDDAFNFHIPFSRFHSKYTLEELCLCELPSHGLKLLSLTEDEAIIRGRRKNSTITLKNHRRKNSSAWTLIETKNNSLFVNELITLAKFIDFLNTFEYNQEKVDEIFEQMEFL